MKIRYYSILKSIKKGFGFDPIFIPKNKKITYGQMSKAKKMKMEKITIEGADLAKEIAKKVNEDFNDKKLPLMLAMINAIVDDRKLELDWEAFR